MTAPTAMLLLESRRRPIRPSQIGVESPNHFEGEYQFGEVLARSVNIYLNQTLPHNHPVDQLRDVHKRTAEILQRLCACQFASVRQMKFGTDGEMHIKSEN